MWSIHDARSEKHQVTCPKVSCFLSLNKRLYLAINLVSM